MNRKEKVQLAQEALERFSFVEVSYANGVNVSLYSIMYDDEGILSLMEALSEIQKLPFVKHSIYPMTVVGYYNDIDDIYLQFSFK